MRISVWAITTVALLWNESGVLAANPPPGAGSTPLVICYYAESLLMGAQRCEAPSLLVEAIFGACFSEEFQLTQKFRTQSAASIVDQQKSINIAIRGIHEEMGPRIQAWMARAQTDNPRCNPAAKPLK
jgi:hypothetical protein